MRTEVVVLTNMCMIVNSKNQVLMQRRKKSWVGCCFPGGHIEALESIVESTKREVKEETNLTITNISFCGTKQWFKDGIRNICFLFKTSDFSGELSNEVEENFWCDIDKIKLLDLSESFDKMLEVFLSEELSELYHKREQDKIDYLFF